VTPVPTMEVPHCCSTGSVLDCPLIICNHCGLDLHAVITPLPSWNTSAAPDALLDTRACLGDAEPSSPQSFAKAARCTRLLADAHDTVLPLRTLCHSCMLSAPGPPTGVDTTGGCGGGSPRPWEWPLEDFRRCGLYLMPADNTASLIGPLLLLPRLSEASASAAVRLRDSRIRLTATVSVSPKSRCLQLVVHAGVCVHNGTSATLYLRGCAPRASSFGHLQAAADNDDGRRRGEGLVSVSPGVTLMVPAQALAMGGFQVMPGAGAPDRCATRSPHHTQLAMSCVGSLDSVPVYGTRCECYRATEIAPDRNGTYTFPVPDSQCAISMVNVKPNASPLCADVQAVEVAVKRATPFPRHIRISYHHNTPTDSKTLPTCYSHSQQPASA
jgi:hypothetical protein